jgi:predicted Na+-dependent transporter
MPTTTSTNVAFTRAANGNETLALANVLIGSLAGIGLSPALVMAYGGGTSVSVILQCRITPGLGSAHGAR